MPSVLYCVAVVEPFLVAGARFLEVKSKQEGCYSSTMDLKHCEFIADCSSLVGIHGCLFKAMATKNFSLLIEQKMFCSHGLEKTSLDANGAATACYELTML